MTAPSKGKYFNLHVAGGGFACVQIPVESAKVKLEDGEFAETVTPPSTTDGLAVGGHFMSQTEDEARQEQVKERERVERFSKKVEAFVERFGEGSDQEREHLIKLLAEEGLIAEEGDEPQRSIDIGLAENFIRDILKEQERNKKSREYDLFTRQLAATTQTNEEQKNPGPSREAIAYAMNQTAQAIRVAYARAVEHEEPGFFRAESRLPASRDKIKAAMVLSAFVHKKLQGQLDKHFLDALLMCYSTLADFVPDEIVERQRKHWEFMEAHRGGELKLIKLRARVDREAEEKGKVEKELADELEEAERQAEKEEQQLDAGRFLTELSQHEIPQELREQCYQESRKLMIEFEQRLSALDDPSLKAEEFLAIRKALLGE